MKTKNTTQKSQETKAIIDQELQSAYDQNDRLGQNEQLREWNQAPLHDTDTCYHPDFEIYGC